MSSLDQPAPVAASDGDVVKAGSAAASRSPSVAGSLPAAVRRDPDHALFQFPAYEVYLLRCARRACLLCGCLMMLAPTIAGAQQDPVEAARQALRDTRQPWYDAESDGVRQLSGARMPTEPTRGDWQFKKRTPWNWNWQGGGNWSWLGELMKYLAWGVLIALLGFLIYALVNAYLNANPMRPTQSLHGAADQELLTDEQRIENLPVALQSKSGDFLSVAASLYRNGQFGDAIVYLFSYRLMQLDRAGFIRLTKGKTNRDYLTELRHHRDLQQLLGQTMVPFEDFFFGKHQLTRERFERCWHSNDRFVRLLQQVQT